MQQETEQLKQSIIKTMEQMGIGDVGFGTVEPEEATGWMKQAISIVVPLSRAVIEEITTEPTHSYFHHYRTVNTLIDQALLRIGLLLQKAGYHYIPVGASQSINRNGNQYSGRYSHKKSAVLCGLGGIGKNSLFLHKDYGPAVRLGTLFTDCDFGAPVHEPMNLCNECDLCVKHCPAMAIKGGNWQLGVERYEIFDPQACSEYMKKQFQHIGRGAVCGICVRQCLKNFPSNEG